MTELLDVRMPDKAEDRISALLRAYRFRVPAPRPPKKPLGILPGGIARGLLLRQLGGRSNAVSPRQGGFLHQ
jgi:hypothetical protein